MSESAAATPAATPTATAESINNAGNADSDADELRQRGNYEFSQHRYDVAVQLYSQALDMCGSSSSNDTSKMNEEVILNLCNRSACYYQMQDFEQAQDDAQRAYEMAQQQLAMKKDKQPRLKAGFRLAKTHMALKEFAQARVVIRESLQLLNEEENIMVDNADDTLQEQDEAAAEDGATESSKLAKVDTRNDNDKQQHQSQTPSLSQQRHAFEDLWKQVLKAAYEDDYDTKSVQKQDELSSSISICTVQRPVSIKEFRKGREIGYGNFSELCVVTHKTTLETFALKIIEKKKAADLAKRQHPNVYNEIQMERRVLLERLPRHPNIVQMYHAFQDYNSLYYLMELHERWSDLWSETKYYYSEHVQTTQSAKYVMIGCHRSQAVVWMAELIDAVEHMHRHGIVHRDLKPENILLDQHGHVIVIDFGTAKDLIQPDLNGPEFVGTPDFMPPEAVNGTSGMEEAAQAASAGQVGSVHTADLWALGAILFMLQTGQTPFASPSPYLAMLKIKRAHVLRPVGIVDNEAWDLIQELMQLDPTTRLGAGAFELEMNANMTNRRIKANPGGYDCIRQHPYFAALHDDDNNEKKKMTPVPTLRDLCYTAVAEQANLQSQNAQLCDDHPPGDGSRHDMIRLDDARDRACVLHVLDRLKLLRDPRVYARFFTDPVTCRINSKVRPATRDFVGLTQMNDDQGKPPKATMNDPYATPVAVDDIEIVHLTNPLFVKSVNESCQEDEVKRKQYVKLLKKCIAAVNRSRPKLVVVTGFVDDKCRKLLARISESVPVVVHDGSAFFSFWIMGVQCIALQSKQEQVTNSDSEQGIWLREQMEQVRMSKHPLFIFTDTDPRELPMPLLKRLARGRSLALYGITSSSSSPPPPAAYEDDNPFSTKIAYTPNEVVDDQSIKSTDSDEDDKDAFTMTIAATHQNGLRFIKVDEQPDCWNDTFQEIGLE